MPILKISKLEDFIKKSPDAGGKRLYRRLPAVMTVMYGFPDKKQKEGPFHQCSSIDISNGGMAIEIIEPAGQPFKKKLANNTLITIKVALPGQKDMIVFQGVIRWLKEEKTATHIRHMVGVEFAKIDPDDKISLISYALHLYRKKKLIKYSIITLSILICLTAAWGVMTHLLKTRVEEELEISEANRARLEKDINNLAIKKHTLEAQQHTLEAELVKESEKMDSTRKIIAQLEDRIYYYIVSSSEELTFVTSKTDAKIFHNEEYIEAKKLLKQKKCGEAIRQLQKLTAAFTKSPSIYSGLTRAYYCTGDSKNSKKAFETFIKLTEAEMEAD